MSGAVVVGNGGGGAPPADEEEVAAGQQQGGEEVPVDVDRVLQQQEQALPQHQMGPPPPPSRPSPPRPVAPHADWQAAKGRLSERGRHLLETGLWADCEFNVGIHQNIKVLLTGQYRAHSS